MEPPLMQAGARALASRLERTASRYDTRSDQRGTPLAAEKPLVEADHPDTIPPIFNTASSTPHMFCQASQATVIVEITAGVVQASSESLPTTDAEGQHLGTTQTLEVKPVQGNPMETTDNTELPTCSLPGTGHAIKDSSTVPATTMLPAVTEALSLATADLRVSAIALKQLPSLVLDSVLQTAPSTPLELVLERNRRAVCVGPNDKRLPGRPCPLQQPPLLQDSSGLHMIAALPAPGFFASWMCCIPRASGTVSRDSATVLRVPVLMPDAMVPPCQEVGGNLSYFAAAADNAAAAEEHVLQPCNALHTGEECLRTAVLAEEDSVEADGVMVDGLREHASHATADAAASEDTHTTLKVTHTFITSRSDRSGAAYGLPYYDSDEEATSADEDHPEPQNVEGGQETFSQGPVDPADVSLTERAQLLAQDKPLVEVVSKATDFLGQLQQLRMAIQQAAAVEGDGGAVPNLSKADAPHTVLGRNTLNKGRSDRASAVIGMQQEVDHGIFSHHQEGIDASVDNVGVGLEMVETSYVRDKLESAHACAPANAPLAKQGKLPGVDVLLDDLESPAAALHAQLKDAGGASKDMGEAEELGVTEEGGHSSDEAHSEEQSLEPDPDAKRKERNRAAKQRSKRNKANHKLLHPVDGLAEVVNDAADSGPCGGRLAMEGAAIEQQGATASLSPSATRPAASSRSKALPTAGRSPPKTPRPTAATTQALGSLQAQPQQRPHSPLPNVALNPPLPSAPLRAAIAAVIPVPVMQAASTSCFPVPEKAASTSGIPAASATTSKTSNSSTPNKRNNSGNSNTNEKNKNTSVRRGGC